MSNLISIPAIALTLHGTGDSAGFFFGGILINTIILEPAIPPETTLLRAQRIAKLKDE